MRPILLIDFGSTYTKVTAVDVDAPALLGTASSYTTVQTDVGEGLARAVAQLEEQTGKLDYAERYACSSAAGGLRMVTCGLVPELTAEAAKQASLGAGAKVVGVYSYQLTEDDLDEIAAARPDIVLLTGGTDGGNRDCILHNAEMLAGVPGDFPVVVAGNRAAARGCQQLLAQKETLLCENVMPRFGVLNIEPAQQKIRDIFLDRIIRAKGLSQASELVSGILMPTPSAMLAAMTLLADGLEGEPGIGELLAVDLGGATTDVYSIASGMPKQLDTVYKGLPEPYAKRTVEGDIGMRYSIHGILEAAGLDRVAQLAELPPETVRQMVEDLAAHTDKLPDSAAGRQLDFALASLAVETAVARHAGTIEQTYTPVGLTYVQTGKDLSDVRRIIATGGALIHAPRPEEAVRHALWSPADPISLRPKQARVWVDRHYILAAMGLLAEHYPKAALQMMKRELTCDGNSK